MQESKVTSANVAEAKLASENVALANLIFAIWELTNLALAHLDLAVVVLGTSVSGFGVWDTSKGRLREPGKKEAGETRGGAGACT